MLKKRVSLLTATVLVLGVVMSSPGAYLLAKAQGSVKAKKVPGLTAGVNADLQHALDQVIPPEERANYEEYARIYTKSLVEAEMTKVVEMAAETGKAIAEEVAAEVIQKEPIWTGWTYFESGKQCWAQTGGDGGHAYGRFQLDSRHSLAPFMRYAVESNSDFAGLEYYYLRKGDRAVLRTMSGLSRDWAWLCTAYGEDFYKAQADFTYAVFYCVARDVILEKRGIDLNDYGPVLKGTVWSIAVRNGNSLSNLRSVTETYYPGISEEEWLWAIYEVESWKHSDSVNRWGYGQLGAAMDTLHMLENGADIEFHETFAADAGEDVNRIEMIGLDCDYRDIVRYTGIVLEE